MAAPSNLHRPVGFTHCRIYRLDADGLLYQTNATAYEGIELTAPKTLEVTKPEARVIPHTGANRLISTDVMPPADSVTAVITADGVDFDIEALLSGNIVATQGEMKLLAHGTEKQGFEPGVAVLGWTQSLDDSGLRRWDFIWLPICRMIPAGRSMNDSAREKSYNLYPQTVTKYPYGVVLTEGTDGATSAQYMEGVSQYKPNAVAFLGTGAAVDFALPATKPAQATTKMKVYTVSVANAFVDVTATVTLATTKVTFAVAPIATMRVFVVYEYA